jgi:crossover junction endodeoxyribonuclease RuvC
MIRHKRPTILAIDPGTRLIGVAVLAGRDLAYQGVKTLRQHGSPHDRLREVRGVLLRLLQDFRPEILAIESAFFAQDRNAALLNVFVDEIKALANDHGVRVRAFAPSTVKKRITGDGRATKSAVAQAIVARFPELRAYLGQDRKWKERYHGNMFDAVAVALVAYRDR